LLSSAKKNKRMKPMKSRLRCAAFLVLLPACSVEEKNACVWAEGFETIGPDSIAIDDVEVVESSSTSITLLAGSVERTITVPARQGVQMPIVGEQLTLARFYSGSSVELGPVTGEARFVPSVRLLRGEATILQISEVQAIESFNSFAEISACDGGSVTRLSATFAVDDGALTLSPTEGAFAVVGGSRFWIELLDGFKATGESGLAYVVEASE
jgi:hypothetical protein